MSIFNFRKRKRFDEAKTNEKALTPACSVHVQKIFALLHAKAVQAAEAKGVKLENTAADGNDPKNAVFHSAGEHMIVARGKKEGEKIDKKIALDGIREYIKVFCGEDVAKKIKDNECFALDDKNIEPTVSEAIGDDHIFSRYLAETCGIKYIVENDVDVFNDDYLIEEDDTTGPEEPGEKKSGEGESGEKKPEGESGEKKPEGESGEKKPEGESGEKKPEGEKTDKEKDQKADAFYVLYGLKIKGLKETTVSDTLKQWGSNFLKGFGVQFDSLWGPGGSGEMHTIGGLMKNIRGIFGAIDDPDELCNRVQDQMKQKFPNISKIDCEFRDKKTLIRELDKRNAKQPYTEGWPDGKNKQKINSADYSMYIHVNGDNLEQPYINRKVIANMVTLQIKGLFKKFKNRIKADDVIYINGAELTGNDQRYDREAMAVIPSYLAIYNEFYDKDDNFKANLIRPVNTINEKFNRAGKNKKILNNEDAKNLIKMWQDFFSNHSDGKFDERTFKTEFLDAYQTKYNEYQKKYKIGDDIDESIYTAYDIIEDLFESQVNGENLTDIYEQPLDYLVLAEDEKDSGESLSDDQKSKIKGPVIDKIFKIAEETIKAGKAKINFAPKMAKFARIDIDVCSNIENCEAAEYNLIEPVLEKVKKSEHPYFIMAYFKIPKEIENSQIKGKGKKDVSEAEFFDETEFLDEADNKTIQYLKKSGLSKEDALKDEEIEKIRQTYSNPPSVDEVKRKIEKYFEKSGDKVPAKTGFTWKGTPGQEGFTEENMKKAFELAVDGEVYDFQRYTVPEASDKFEYYNTDPKVPADVDVFFALADKLKDVDPPSSGVKMHFAVSNNLEEPDFKDILKFLNDEKPVKAEDVTNEFLEKLQHEAEDCVKDKGKYTFVMWTPNPKSPPDSPNGKGPDGEPAIVICAKFKKEGDEPEPDPPEPDPPEPDPSGDSDQKGDDLYIIPMPGVKYSDIDDEGFTKTM